MFKKALAMSLCAVMALSVVGCDKGGAGEAKTEYGEVVLADYKGLEVYEDDIAVSDEDYEAAVKELLEQDSEIENLDKGTVEDDSVVVLDYDGEIEVDGKKQKFDGGSAMNATINVETDTSYYIDGFVSCLKGHKVGDEFTEELQFPEDYGQKTKINDKEIDLSGQKVWFTYKINGLQITKTPELTDEWAKEQYGPYGVTDVKSFEEYERDFLRDNNIMNKVWPKYMESCEVKSINEKEKESVLSQYIEQAGQQIENQYQQDIDTYLEACSMSMEDFKKKMDESYGVTNSLEMKAVIMAIADKEGLIPSDEDYKKEGEKIAKLNDMTIEEIEENYGKDQLVYSVICQRVQDLICDNVKLLEGSEPTSAPETTAADETAAPAEDATKAE